MKENVSNNITLIFETSFKIVNKYIENEKYFFRVEFVFDHFDIETDRKLYKNYNIGDIFDIQLIYKNEYKN